MFAGYFVVADVAGWVGKCGEFGAWATRGAVLADGGLAEGGLLAGGVPVDVDVCYAHCGGWEVCI